jgi:hypothetical protein
MSAMCLTLWVSALSASDSYPKKDKSQVKSRPPTVKNVPNHQYIGTAPLYYRLRTNPRVYRAWQEKNYFEDFENTLRSPLNRESDLDYLLRTF